eukprot:545422-Prymnesium_polylepis.1
MAQRTRAHGGDQRPRPWACGAFPLQGVPESWVDGWRWGMLTVLVGGPTIAGAHGGDQGTRPWMWAVDGFRRALSA